MNKLIIYQSNLIYAALYYKRLHQPSGLVTLTEKEFADYFDLVINDIEEERAIANSFSYEIIYDGEPKYNLNLADEKTLNLLKSTSFNHDKNLKVFTCNATKEALSLKKSLAYPPSINMTLRPKGYDDALNINTNKQNKNDTEPSK